MYVSPFMNLLATLLYFNKVGSAVWCLTEKSIKQHAVSCKKTIYKYRNKKITLLEYNLLD